MDTKAFSDFIENFRGSFFSGFFLVVNITAFCLQALVVSRIVKYIGMKGVLFMLPLVAFGAYGLIAIGAGFTIMRWAKCLDASTNCSSFIRARAERGVLVRERRTVQFSREGASNTTMEGGGAVRFQNV